MANLKEIYWNAQCVHSTVRMIKTNAGRPFALKCTTCPVTLSVRMRVDENGDQREIVD